MHPASYDSFSFIAARAQTAVSPFFFGKRVDDLPDFSILPFFALLSNWLNLRLLKCLPLFFYWQSGGQKLLLKREEESIMPQKAAMVVKPDLPPK